MYITTTVRGLAAAVTLVVACSSLMSPRAAAGFPFARPCLNQTGCSICCPVCDHTCNLEAERVEEETPCFDVESKLICIPRVVFPWQKKKCSSCDACDGQGCSNCVHNGARVRRICVLKSDSKTCPKCKYTWSTADKCSGCDSGSCDSVGCDSVGSDSANTRAWDGTIRYPAAARMVTDSSEVWPINALGE